MNQLTTEELEKQANKIMDNFNFEKVHKHMVDTDWKWYMGGGAEPRVPNIDDLRLQARILLTKAIYEPKESANVGTGGFTAYKLYYGLRLTFELTHSI